MDKTTRRDEKKSVKETLQYCNVVFQRCNIATICFKNETACYFSPCPSDRPYFTILRHNVVRLIPRRAAARVICPLLAFQAESIACTSVFILCSFNAAALPVTI